MHTLARAAIAVAVLAATTIPSTPARADTADSAEFSTAVLLAQPVKYGWETYDVSVACAAGQSFVVRTITALTDGFAGTDSVRFEIGLWGLQTSPNTITNVVLPFNVNGPGLHTLMLPVAHRTTGSLRVVRTHGVAPGAAVTLLFGGRCAPTPPATTVRRTGAGG